MNLPDAPWIRKAETEGYPFDGPDYAVKCPVCDAECETIYEDAYGTVAGCDKCLIWKDAWEWYEEKREADRDES